MPVWRGQKAYETYRDAVEAQCRDHPMVRYRVTPVSWDDLPDKVQLMWGEVEVATYFILFPVTEG